MFTYHVHGTTLQTPLVLPCGSDSGGSSQPEFEHLGAAELPAAPKDAEPVAFLRLGDAGYSAVREGPTVWLEFRKQSLFIFSEDFRRIRHCVLPGGDPRLVEQFLPNAVMALGLGMQGRPLLHASAVCTAGSSIAIVGPSGAGKSSIAAALCSTGSSLITDDTLHLEIQRGEAIASPGCSRLRLRMSGAKLAAEIGGGQAKPTSDGRLGIELPPNRTETPLTCLWIPVLGAPASPLRLRELFGQHRLLSVVSNVRIAGWSPKLMASLLPQLREIASTVRCYRLELPDGLVFSEAGREQLSELARSCSAGSAPA